MSIILRKTGTTANLNHTTDYPTSTHFKQFKLCMMIQTIQLLMDALQTASMNVLINVESISLMADKALRSISMPM